MTSNRPLNSKEALEESTATSSSVMLSGARREKVGLDINDYSRNPGNSQSGVRDQRSEVRGQRRIEDGDSELTLRLICNPQHNFPAGMMRGGLLFRRDRFTQWQNLRHNWLDFPGVDQVRDFGEVFGFRLNPHGCAANLAFFDLDWIGARNQ